MDEKIFNRVEKKYLISSEQQKRLKKEIKKYLKEDNYHKSEVYNIYFDTDNYDLIIQSIDRPIFKEKLRARSYGGYDKVFLEIKTKVLGRAYRKDLLEDDDALKDNNYGFKRRVLISHKDYEELLNGKADVETLATRDMEKASDIQIAREVDYMLKHFDLKPKILLYYKRESYKGGQILRITFDTDVKYRTKTLKFNKKKSDKALLKDEKNIIMEIKAEDAMPLWLVKMLSSEHIYPTQFSKIGKVYEKLRKEKNV